MYPGETDAFKGLRRIFRTGGPMRKNRTKETEEQRNERFEKIAQRQIEGATAEDKAIDAMVKRSIKLHGP
jgi:hypothetical protein